MSANAITVGMGENRPTVARRGGAAAARWWSGTALALVAMLLFAGCLSDAADTCYTFANTTCEDGTGSGSVVIDYVSPAGDTVWLLNVGTLTQDLDGWQLEQEGGSVANYTFSVFTLAVDEFVRIRSETGTDTASDLFWDPGASWTSTDTAILKDDTATVVDTCTSGNTCWGN